MLFSDMTLSASKPRNAPRRPRYAGLRVTREQYLQLEDDGFKYDMIDGVLSVPPSADFYHGKRYGRFYRFLDEYLEAHPLGEMTQETDIFLPDGGDMLRPDLCFVLNENRGSIRTHLHGTPDLVCEVLSPSTRQRDLGVKADRYLANGVSEYWIIDPEHEHIEVRYAEQDAAGKRAWQTRSGKTLKSRLLPGFEIQTKRIWK